MGFRVGRAIRRLHYDYTHRVNRQPNQAARGGLEAQHPSTPIVKEVQFNQPFNRSSSLCRIILLLLHVTYGVLPTDLIQTQNITALNH